MERTDDRDDVGVENPDEEMAADAVDALDEQLVGQLVDGSGRNRG